MSNAMYVFINVLIYWVVVTGMETIEPGSAGLGVVVTLVVGGLIFAFVAMAAEPLLAFFKFPVNFWGLLVVGFILNLIFFGILSTGVFPAPALLKFSTGSFGEEFKPLPLMVELGNKFLVAMVAALFSTLLQILVRRIGQ